MEIPQLLMNVTQIRIKKICKIERKGDFVSEKNLPVAAHCKHSQECRDSPSAGNLDRERKRFFQRCLRGSRRPSPRSLEEYIWIHGRLQPHCRLKRLKFRIYP